MSAEQFNEWILQYEQADLLHTDYARNGGQEWNKCLSSDQARAAQTARSLYKGEVTFTTLLREIGIAAVMLPGIKLPVSCWLTVGRLCWALGHHSQPENRVTAKTKARLLIDSLETREQPENVLMVSHGAFMKLLERELRRRGFKGRRMFHPQKGKLYMYEKE
ncbi:histidine phosphatase family protein [Paenibacillus sp. 22594]|uniref:histidine phosphatase family protein n=1 Tax=Paenibacillus sp. 22594 TaxID=3453947 RepID=UPI003F86CD97